MWDAKQGQWSARIYDLKLLCDSDHTAGQPTSWGAECDRPLVLTPCTGLGPSPQSPNWSEPTVHWTGPDHWSTKRSGTIGRPAHWSYEHLPKLQPPGPRANEQGALAAGSPSEVRRVIRLASLSRSGEFRSWLVVSFSANVQGPCPLFVQRTYEAGIELAVATAPQKV